MAEAAGIGGVNIPDYLKTALTKAAGTVSDTFTDVSSIMTQAGSTSVAEQAAMKESAAAKSEVERLQTARKLSKEAANKAQIAEFGTNPEASSYVLSSMAHSLIQQHGELIQRDKALQSKLDTKFGDDPIGWLTNQFTIPGDVLAFAHKAEALDRTNAVMEKLLARSKDVVALNAAIDSGTNLEISAALEKQNMNEAIVRSSEAQQRLQTMNLNAVNIRRATTMDSVRIMLDAQNMDFKVQELQLQRAAGWRAEQALVLQREMKELAMDEKLEKMETKVILQKKLNNIAAVTGSKPITVGEYMAASGKTRDMYERLMTDPDIENQRIGYNTAVAVETANQYNFPLTPGINYVRDKLIKIAATAPALIPVGQTPYDKLKPAEQLAVTQKAYEAAIAKERLAIPIEGGIYSPPSLSKVLEIPTVQMLSLAKDLSPLAQNKETPTDPGLLFATAIDKINRGESTPKQMAAELKFIFTAISMDNNTQRDYKRLVLPPLTEKAGYKMNVYTGKGWKGLENLDLTNNIQVENALMRQIAQQALDKQFRGETQ